MNKVSLVLIYAMALGLIGCGSGGSGGSVESSTATAGSSAGASAGQSTAESTVGSTVASTAGSSDTVTDDAISVTTDIATEDADSAAADTGGAAGGSVSGSQGDNPGTIPDPIIAEVTSIDLSTFAGPAGYKIYSGDTIDPALPADFVDFVENRYINLEFPCSSETGNIEVFPREFFEFEAEDPYGGTFSWETADPQDEFGSVDIEIATITYGEPTNVGLPFNVDNIVNGSLIVGSGLFEDLIITRIVQFDLCN